MSKPKDRPLPLGFGLVFKPPNARKITVREPDRDRGIPLALDLFRGRPALARKANGIRPGFEVIYITLPAFQAFKDRAKRIGGSTDGLYGGVGFNPRTGLRCKFGYFLRHFMTTSNDER